MSIYLLLIIVAFVLALLGAFNVPSRISWLCMAFAMFMLALILNGTTALHL